MILTSNDIMCLILAIVGSVLAIAELAIYGNEIMFKEDDE